VSRKRDNRKRNTNAASILERKVKGSGKVLRFVVQKHHGRQLHYDFRLELDGVLKSWAVPKGPSLDPSVKHLAMMVEDHQLDYKDFEGVIDEGYGAGKVIVWDRGTYRSIDTTDRLKGEELLRKGLTKGDLKFILEGKKLKGEFILVKMKNPKMGKNTWLLIKKNDKYASKNNVLNKDKSVISGKKIDEMGN
jgi:bifunctional non-homologous end joining protein LigD